MSSSSQRGRPVRGGGSSGRPIRPDRRMRLFSIEENHRRRRFILIFGFAVFLAISGLLIGGWYTQYYSPPRVKAAVVNGTRFSQGDLVKRVRMIQATENYSQTTGLSMTEILKVLFNPDIDVMAGPFNLGMVQMELLKQGAPEYGIQVFDSEIDDAIRIRFTPQLPQGQEATPEQIEDEFKERYRSILNRFRISDEDYRRIAEEQLYFFKMKDALGANPPKEAEHVEASWIRVPLRPDSRVGDPQNWQDAPTVRATLDTEDFEKVAQQYSPVFKFAKPNGYVGWVPKGAFPELDPFLFGDGSQERLNRGEISEPIQSGDFFYIMKITSERELREVGDEWTSKLKDIALETWLLDRYEQGIAEGWLEVNYDSTIYAWAAKQFQQTAGQRRGG